MKIINIKNKLLQHKNGIYLFSLLFFFILSCNDSSSPSVVKTPLADDDFTLNIANSTLARGYTNDITYGTVNITNAKVAIANVTPEEAAPFIILNPNNPLEIVIKLGLAEGNYTFDVVVTADSNNPNYTGSATKSQTLNVKIPVNASDIINEDVIRLSATSGYSARFLGVTFFVSEAIENPVVSISNIKDPAGNPVDNNNQIFIGFNDNNYVIFIEPGLNDVGDYTFEVVITAAADDPKYTGSAKKSFTLTINQAKIPLDTVDFIFNVEANAREKKVGYRLYDFGYISSLTIVPDIIGTGGLLFKFTTPIIEIKDSSGNVIDKPEDYIQLVSDSSRILVYIVEGLAVGEYTFTITFTIKPDDDRFQGSKTLTETLEIIP